MEHPHPMFTAHTNTLERALTAIAERAYWSAYPESPSPRIYGEHAAADGEAAFRAYLADGFPLADQPAITGWVATETSPFGIPLEVRYPHLRVAEPDDPGTHCVPLTCAPSGSDRCRVLRSRRSPGRGCPRSR